MEDYEGYEAIDVEDDEGYEAIDVEEDDLFRTRGLRLEG